MEQSDLYIRLSKDERAVEILDQTLLPGREVWLSLREQDELCEAITSLRVRGAPAIGIFAAFALYVLTVNRNAPDYKAFLVSFKEHCAALLATRPTAVNLQYAILRQVMAAKNANPQTVKVICDKLRLEALAIQNEDIETCKSIAEYGLSLLKPGDAVLTHCNAGPLATSRYGTALGPILLATERHYRLHVFCDETRPLLQGARLTAYELRRAGADYTLICDSAAGMVLKTKKVAAVFVGCDRMAANGDAANKIGTSSLAILAKHYGVPFYFCCPFSSIDQGAQSGDDIVIEERGSEEITSLYYENPMAPAGTKCFNPAFDITDHSLITAVITEKGILHPPFQFSKEEEEQ